MLQRGTYYEAMMISLPITTLENDQARLEPLAEAHREELRAACNADSEIWEIYPYSMRDPYFDEYWQGAMTGQGSGAQHIYAVLAGSATVGTTSYYTRPDLPEESVSIGGTYFAPDQRGTKLNPACKLLQMEHAFANGMAGLLSCGYAQPEITGGSAQAWRQADAGHRKGQDNLDRLCSRFGGICDCAGRLACRARGACAAIAGIIPTGVWNDSSTPTL